MRPKLLDLYCGAGGCARGYHEAGFDCYGVDSAPQPRYPYAFERGCALAALHLLLDGGQLFGLALSDFAAIHASPVCKGFSSLRNLHRHKEYPNDIPECRRLLSHSGLPYVIENVEGAPLRFPARLCGTWFGLGTGDAELRRHRLFETNWPLFGTPCHHGTRRQALAVKGGEFDVQFAGQRKSSVITVTQQGGQDQRYGYSHRGEAVRTVSVCGHTSGHSTLAGRRLFNVTECREAMGIDWMTQAELSQAIPPAYTRWIGEQLLALLQSEG